MKYLLYFFQGLILVILTPLFIGYIKYLKGLIRGYKGPSMVQPYYDIKKLFSKGRVISKSSSFITSVVPIANITTVITAAFMVPVFFSSGNSFLGNLFIIIFILGISKFLTALLGLDSASTFGGMGSSRELFISMFAEPVMFMTAAYLYFETKSLNVFQIALTNAESIKYNISHIIAAMGFVVVISAENARMPVDNPETHLELTMVHEAMILDLSGRDLALIELASYTKFIIYITLLINCFFPMGLASELAITSIIASLSLYLLKVLGALTVIALVESLMAKLRLFRVPELLSAAFSLSLVALVINYF